MKRRSKPRRRKKGRRLPRAWGQRPYLARWIIIPLIIAILVIALYRTLG